MAEGGNGKAGMAGMTEGGNGGRREWRKNEKAMGKTRLGYKLPGQFIIIEIVCRAYPATSLGSGPRLTKRLRPLTG